MPLILHIESATAVCSVALSRDGHMLALKESTSGNSHSSVLAVFIDQIFNETGTDIRSLDAVAVSKGPGSYTGLRIGVASAKGICYATDKPLIAVGSLQSMAAGMILTLPAEERRNYLYCPMIDARRMEVYCALFDAEGIEVRETRAEVIDGSSFGDHLVKSRILFGGDGADKCREVLSHHPNAVFAEGFHISARFMLPLAEQNFQSGRFEDLAYFEPFYLKDFIAGKPRVKGLR